MTHQHTAALLMPLMLMAFGVGLWAINHLLARYLPDGKIKRLLLRKFWR